MVRGWNAAREVGWWCLQLAECLLACFPAAWCCCSGCQCPQRSTATSARTRDPAGSSRCDSAGWCAHGPEQVEIDVPMCSGHALDAAATMGRGLVGCCKGRQWMRWGDLFKLSIKTRRQHARLKTWGVDLQRREAGRRPITGRPAASLVGQCGASRAPCRQGPLRLLGGSAQQKPILDQHPLIHPP